MTAQQLQVLQAVLNSPVLANLVWVGVVIAVLILFKSQLTTLLTGLSELEWLGGKLKWRSPELRPTPDKEVMSRDAHIYWLGHDIMFTMDVILRDLGFDHIVHGLRVSVIHARAIELGEYVVILEGLLSNLITQPKALTREDRIKLLQTLDDLRMQIGKLLNGR